VCNLVVGLFFLSAGATLGDAYRTQPARLAAASGTLYALVNGGFAAGIGTIAGRRSPLLCRPQ
jgi:hypothetical protein